MRRLPQGRSLPSDAYPRTVPVTPFTTTPYESNLPVTLGTAPRRAARSYAGQSQTNNTIEYPYLVGVFDEDGLENLDQEIFMGQQLMANRSAPDNPVVNLLTVRHVNGLMRNYYNDAVKLFDVDLAEARKVVSNSNLSGDEYRQLWALGYMLWNYYEPWT